MADFLAKKVNQNISLTSYKRIPHSFIKKYFHNKIIKIWQKDLDDGNTGRLIQFYFFNKKI